MLPSRPLSPQQAHHVTPFPSTGPMPFQGGMRGTWVLRGGLADHGWHAVVCFIKVVFYEACGRSSRERKATGSSAFCGALRSAARKWIAPSKAARHPMRCATRSCRLCPRPPAPQPRTPHLVPFKVVCACECGMSEQGPRVPEILERQGASLLTSDQQVFSRRGATRKLS